MTVVRGDALRIPLRDESVDLIVTSPPYFALRSYRDGGEHYDGQIGSEPHPRLFLEALWAVTAECWRVLKPSGSMFVNLGDKRAGSGGGNQSGLQSAHRGGGLNGFDSPTRYNQAAFGRPKSKMLLPHRYAIGCEDGHADPHGTGWIVRQDLVWWKPNGLPESVRDRTRDSHEYWFHLTKSERYYAAVDRIRQPYSARVMDRQKYVGREGVAPRGGPSERNDVGRAAGILGFGDGRIDPLGALPPSVWQIATEPLTVPDHVGVDHFAAFPSEWPRRLILGWSPTGICQACGQGRVPVVDRALAVNGFDWNAIGKTDDTGFSGTERPGGFNDWRSDKPIGKRVVTETGESCACPTPSAPTLPSVILDPFGGTGTTAMVARALGRNAVNLDLSADYCRLARWRIYTSGGASKARTRTNAEMQQAML